MLQRGFLALALLGALAAAAVPAVAAHPFRIVNAGRHVATAVNISGVNRRLWGPNLLRGALVPGRQASFAIGEGCMEDVRIIYSNRHVAQQGGFNTCRYDLRLTY